MAKNKDLKRLEAEYRKLRGEVFNSFSQGTDDKVRRDYGEYGIEKREKLWEDYKKIPWAWREKAFDGWHIMSADLSERLELERIEQGAIALDNLTTLSTAAPRRMRM